MIMIGEGRGMIVMGRRGMKRNFQCLCIIVWVMVNEFRKL